MIPIYAHIYIFIFIFIYFKHNNNCLLLKGMSNSDNVVRAGLTPKQKDVNTLIKVISTYSLIYFHYSSQS